MAFFKKAESTSAYLKAGLLGFAGSGKTYTAVELAVGLALLINKLKLREAGRPIFFADTETGSDYVIPKVRKAGLEIFTAKTRAFADLVPMIEECEKGGSVLIIDSITHFWREFTETYQRKKNITRLEFQDWNALKADWGKFTDKYINSPCHIVMCGRAGFEYENETNERTGKKEIVKAGVKMKAESETGYEPSLLVLMEREHDMKTNQVHRTAYVLKERFSQIDGKHFENPTFESFKPHIDLLNLGGQQLGVDTSRTSESMIAPDGDTKWRHEQRQKEIALEEIAEEIAKLYPSQTAEHKKARADLLERIFGTRSWKAVEAKSIVDVANGRNTLWLESRGHPYGVTPGAEKPAEQLQDDDDIPHDAPAEKPAATEAA